MIEPVAYCLAILFALAALGPVTARFRAASGAIYLGCTLVCLALLWFGVTSISAVTERMTLPLGLPWIGVNLRLDPLSSAFVALIGLGGASACFYAIGYGRHEHEPGRVVPFVPAFLAGMTLVVLADDA